ncbi:MAG: hypothetical protein H6Q32_473 [Bacteroidetes bacterium]|nr:hypothetical protein [Bacteroidota bacterium]
MRRVLAVLLILPLLLPATAAMAGSGGSIYSFLGIGDLRLAPNVRAAGMGYTGYAIGNPHYINTLSPASWTRIERARIEASMLYEGYQSTNGSISRYLARGDFNGAMLALPLSPSKGIVVAAGFTPSAGDNSAFPTHRRGASRWVSDSTTFSERWKRRARSRRAPPRTREGRRTKRRP